MTLEGNTIKCDAYGCRTEDSFEGELSPEDALTRFHGRLAVHRARRSGSLEIIGSPSWTHHRYRMSNLGPRRPERGSPSVDRREANAGTAHCSGNPDTERLAVIPYHRCAGRWRFAGGAMGATTQRAGIKSLIDNGRPMY